MEQLVKEWFAKWNSGNYMDLPLAKNFKHTSPFGTIEGKEAYLNLVKENEDKFLGYHFEIHDAIYEKDKACVRYTGSQGEEFKLDVSEWFFPDGDQIGEIVSYYHIGEIREERKLEE